MYQAQARYTTVVQYLVPGSNTCTLVQYSKTSTLKATFNLGFWQWRYRVSRGRVPLPQEKVTLDQIIVFSLVFLPGFLPLFSPFARLFIQIR